MAKQIKLSADTKDLKKSILDLSKSIKKDLGQSKVNLFSSKSEKLLKTEAKVALKDIAKVTKEITSLMDKQTEVIKNTTRGTKEYRQEVNKLLGLQRQLTQVQGAKAPLSGIAGGGGLAKFGKLGILSKLGIAGTLAGVGMYGFSRAKAGVSRFDEAVSSRLGLRGRGVQDFNLSGLERVQSAQYGVTRNELERRRLQGMDIFGKEGATTESVLGRAKFERGVGLEAGTMAQFGAGFRGVLGGSRSLEAVSKLQASLLASGVEDEIGPYLETAANALVSINKNGLTNQAEILAAFADLTKKTGESPEIIGKDLQTIDSTLRVSTGDRNAFAQVAFARAGIGGRTIGGVQAAIRSGGLFGADLSQLPESQRKQLEKLGLGTTGFRQRSGALLKEFQNLGFNIGPQATPQDLVTTGRGAMGFFGAKNEVEGLRIVNLLRKAQEGDPGAARRLREIQKDPNLKNLENIFKSSEGQLDELRAIRRTIEAEIGEGLTPVTIASRNALKSIDELIQTILPSVGAIAKGITNLLGFFGVETPTMQAEKISMVKNMDLQPIMNQIAIREGVGNTILDKNDLGLTKPGDSNKLDKTISIKNSKDNETNEAILNVLKVINSNLESGNKTRVNMSKAKIRPVQTLPTLESTLGD